MKNLLLFIAFSAASLAQSQMSINLTNEKPRMVVDPRTGEYTHDENTKTRLLSVTPTQVIIECERTTVYFFTYANVGGTSPAPNVERWREVYQVSGNRLLFVRSVVPKVTPAQPERIEWPELDAKP